MTEPELHAVVAGDIVGSTELDAQVRRNLAGILEDAYETVLSTYGDALPYELALSAGDEWRLYIARPEVALAVSLAFYARLKERDITSRLVLAIDEIDFIEDGDLHNSDGAAFRRAGRGLAAVLGEQWRFALLLPDDENPLGELCGEFLGELVDILLKELTPAQARAVAEMICLSRGDQRVTTTEIARRWKPDEITRQAVGKHLQRAGWSVFERTLNRYERMIGEIEMGYHVVLYEDRMMEFEERHGD